MGGSSRDWRVYRERIWLRELLTQVAQYLELVGARDRDLARLLLPVAQRIRKRLHDGMPEEWRPNETHRPRLE